MTRIETGMAVTRGRKSAQKLFRDQLRSAEKWLQGRSLLTEFKRYAQFERKFRKEVERGNANEYWGGVTCYERWLHSLHLISVIAARLAWEGIELAAERTGVRREQK